MRGCPANSKGTYKSFHLFIRVTQSLRRDLGGWVYAGIPTDIVYSESYAALKIKELYSKKKVFRANSVAKCKREMSPAPAI